MNAVKLDYKGLDVIFNYFSNKVDGFCWIRNSDYTKQLFISESFTSIWGIPTAELYESPTIWGSLIETNNMDATDKHIREQYANNENPSNNAVFYRICNANNKRHWIKDHGFYLYDEGGVCIAVAGFGEVISENEWLAEVAQQQQKTNFPADLSKKRDFLDIIKTELQVSSFSPNSLLQGGATQTNEVYQAWYRGKATSLSKREAQCLYYLLQGKTAKQIAQCLYLSHRTIEEYVNQVRLKMGFNNKYELISRIKVEDIRVINRGN